MVHTSAPHTRRPSGVDPVGQRAGPGPIGSVLAAAQLQQALAELAAVEAVPTLRHHRLAGPGPHPGAAPRPPGPQPRPRRGSPRHRVDRPPAGPWRPAWSDAGKPSRGVGDGRGQHLGQRPGGRSARAAPASRRRSPGTVTDRMSSLEGHGRGALGPQPIGVGARAGPARRVEGGAPWPSWTRANRSPPIPHM